MVNEEDACRDMLVLMKAASQRVPAVNTGGKQAEGKEWPGAATTSLTLPENQKRTKQRCLESYGRAWKSTLKGSQQIPSEVLHRCHCPFVCVAVESVCTEEYV